MNLPTSVPEHDPSGLWSLQGHLLELAEKLLGERDKSKQIHQPAFHDNGPHIRNTPSFDGAFVELGNGSKVYWPTVVYEMAHETVHLLNPIAGYTNWLEEGIAVEFSIYAQQEYGLSRIQYPQSGPYHDALELVRSLPEGALRSAHRVREAIGSLSSATFEQLSSMFPTHDPDNLRKLSAQCVPR